jgi:MYXO-CTERM domain-containing protein
MLSFSRTWFSDSAARSLPKARTLRSVLTAAAAVVVACGAYGCSAEWAEGTDGTSNEIVSKDIDPDRLLEDSDILGGANITAADVQKFLESKDSYLATYKEGGSTAAEIIVERCREKGVSPVYMLARIQGESSLVESKTSKNVAKATGCGCPDGKGCAAEHAGFGNQIACSANLIRKYFTQLETKGTTTSGYAVGKPLKTLDPCSVTPANKATVALYTYTPWVGAYASGGCGGSTMGSSGMAMLTAKYRSALPKSTDADGTAKKPFCETPAGKEDPMCGLPGVDPNTGKLPGEDPAACVAKTAAVACKDAWLATGAICGRVPDGCTGTVSCDAVEGFGCTSTQSCKENFCETTACVPKAAAQLCATARTTQGVTCGRISDGCGGEVNCDKQEGFGCATGKICNAQRKCVTDTTLPPPSTGNKPSDKPAGTDTDTAKDKPADEATKTKGTPVGPASDEGADDKTPSSSSDGNTKKPADSTKKPKKAASGGCSAAPGGPAENAGTALTAFAALAVLARRRRRDTRAS